MKLNFFHFAIYYYYAPDLLRRTSQIFLFNIEFTFEIKKIDDLIF